MEFKEQFEQTLGKYREVAESSRQAQEKAKQETLTSLVTSFTDFLSSARQEHCYSGSFNDYQRYDLHYTFVDGSLSRILDVENRETGIYQLALHTSCRDCGHRDARRLLLRIPKEMAEKIGAGFENTEFLQAYLHSNVLGYEHQGYRLPRPLLDVTEQGNTGSLYDERYYQGKLSMFNLDRVTAKELFQKFATMKYAQKAEE